MEKQAFDSPCRPRFSSDSSSGDDLTHFPASDGGSSHDRSASSEEADENPENSSIESSSNDTDKSGTSAKDDSGPDCAGSSPGSATDGDSSSVPSAELVDRILKQVELYFSDENVLRDAFLLKHVRRNKEGYVSLKLVASFRKVKSLSKDWQTVAYALKQSSKLEVDANGSKVRRRDPLPSHDETAPSRTVVVFNMPFDKPTVEGVGEMFSKFGEIVLIRILRPGGPVPPDIRRFLNKHPEVATMVCSVVEFESHSAARAAVEELDSKSDPTALRVLPVMEKVVNTGDNAKKANRDKTTTGGVVRKKDKKQSRINQLKADESPVASNSESELSPVTRRRSSSSSSGYLSSSPQECGPWRRSGSASKTGTAKSGRKTGKDPCRVAVPMLENLSGSVCPWVQKRITAKEGVDGVPSAIQTTIPVAIIRQPRGPDVTGGFHYLRDPMSMNSVLTTV